MKEFNLPSVRMRFLKKHENKLTFTAYGNPFFTYKYKKIGILEKDAEILLKTTKDLLEEMKELLLNN